MGTNKKRSPTELSASCPALALPAHNHIDPFKNTTNNHSSSRTKSFMSQWQFLSWSILYSTALIVLQRSLVFSPSLDTHVWKATTATTPLPPEQTNRSLTSIPSSICLAFAFLHPMTHPST